MKTVILASQMTGCMDAITSIASERADGVRLLYVPTAAYGENWEPDPATDILPFSRAGFDVEIYDLRGKNRIQTENALDRSHVVFVGGGNTFFLLHHMHESGFFDAIGPRVAQGLVYVGSSAGAVVATPDIGYAASVDDPSKGGRHGDGGLGFVDRPVLPHIDHAAFAPYVREIADAFEKAGQEYYGLCDDEAVVLEDGVVRLVKSRQAAETDAPRLPGL